MNWTAFFIAGIALLAAAIAAAVCISRRPSLRASRVLTPFNAIFAGVFLATFALLLPVCDSVCAGESWQGFKTVFFALHQTFQVFTVDSEMTILFEQITPAVGPLATVYSAVLSVLFVAAPIFTFGFLISFFRNASAYLRLLWQRRRELYVFSELNERSLALATDIHRNHPAAAIVFTDVFENNEESASELAGKAKELGGICFQKNILAVDLRLHSAVKPMYLFAIGEDETKNVSQAQKLVLQYGQIPAGNLYVFSSQAESELLLSNSHGLPMKVRRVSEVRSLINRVLYERGAELFANALPTETGERRIHAVLVGLGAHGTEMLKALVWFCQMDGYRVELDAYDRDPLAEERFAALCPELMSPRYNGVSVPGEAEYTIRIHSGVDTETRSFAESILHMTDVTYAFVALGTDGNNVKTAANLRMLFERAHITPVIHAVVRRGSTETNPLEGAVNFKGQAYRIECIGDLESSCSEKVILNSELEEDALQRHLKWGREEEFWWYEYNYRSSIASAIHMRARIACGIPGADKEEAELTDAEKAVIEPLEHRRWNAYMRSEGYVYSGSKEKSSRNDLGKMHHDLVDFAALSEEDKRKDSSVGSK